ncbi:MAG: potassium transporter TrkG [Eubacteriales bacterium]|nr:potassium transporter TrkG [Eubacteriales bacterium]
MPVCAAPGQHTTFTDAMFTAATCVCVTGLVTVPTALHWSGLGKAVILLLIQTGGIGLISIASLIFVGLHKKITMRNRRMIQEAYNLDQMSGLVRMVKRVVFCVFAAEGLGAFFYALSFVPLFGWKKGLIQSVFTAVSAFCNAGVDILGENSLSPFVDNVPVNLTTMGLITASGLGFTVWWDLADKVKKVFQKKLSVQRVYRTLRLHSKLVLKTSATLSIGGTLLILLFEHGNPATMKDMPFWEKLLASAFQSVSTRTAGFFTIDQAAFSGSTTILCLVFMLIGGSPMGTAGGIKTTTVAVLFLSVAANLRGKRDVECHGRRIRGSYVRSAVVVTSMALLVLFTMLMLLSAVMPQAGLTDIAYELTSSIGTVGLTRGLTPRLSIPGKWIVMVTMYLGRIGPLTLGSAVVARAARRPEKVELAAEDIMIG